MDKYIHSMMGTADLFSKQSYCKKKQVGAVLARDGRILATGYNGTISQKENKCEDEYYECPKCGNKSGYIEDLVELYQSEQPEMRSYLFDGFCKQCKSKIISNSISYFDFKNKNYNNQKQIIKLNPIIKTSEFTVHAEQNIITYCAKNGISTDGTTMYVTMSPCKQCAKLIAQAGITKLIYRDNYKDMSGIEFLKKVNIKVKKYNKRKHN